MIETSPNNRMTDFLGDAPADVISVVASRRRSPAQRAASRKNGAMSRGPTTSEGKARSSANSLKHGLLARRILPPCDGRGDDKMFRRARRALIEELRPATFTQCALVDALAGDYVMLARARAMVEALYRPAPPPWTDAGKFKRLQDAGGELRALDALLAGCAAGQPFACDAGDARRVADELAALTKQLQSEISDIRAEQAIGEGPSDDFEIQEDEQRLRLWASIEPALERFVDATYLAEVLIGARTPVQGDGERLAEPLRTLRDGVRRRLADRPTFERAAGLRQGVKQANLACSPQPLMLLDRYVARIERGIEKKLRQLRSR